MLIDWFTVIAQMINFGILVVLLKYVLFDRITKAMEHREKRIRSTLEEAEALRKHAGEEIDHYKAMKQDLDEDRKRILADVREEAESLRKLLIENARTETNEVKARWLESIQRERNWFLQELRQRIGNEALSIVRAALSDLADAELEHRMVKVFEEQVRAMPAEMLHNIKEIVRTTGGEIVIHAAFEVSEIDRISIKEVLTNHIGQELRVRIETWADTICGIELRLLGHRIGWSIDSYLSILEKTVSASLGEPGQSSGSNVGDRNSAGHPQPRTPEHTGQTPEKQKFES